MITYEQWNKAIVSYFFERAEPGQIVFLQTDADTLGEIAKTSDFNVSDAVESLKTAVQDKAVVEELGVVNLWKVNPNLWEDYSQEEPPQVAFLALTVFAATLMEAEGAMASHNYYGRLHQVLFGRVNEGTPPGFTRRKFAKFWKHLRRWALEQHDVVLYLTEGSSNRKYVWYPISQCLISKHHQRDIYCFFRDHNLTPFSPILDDQLERHLRNSGLTKIESYLSDPFYRDLILSQVRSLLQNWDGEIPPKPFRGERQATASVNVEIQFNQSNDGSNNSVKIHYWFPTLGRNKVRCRANPLGIEYLQPSHLEKWFRPVSDTKGAFWNRNPSNRLQLRTDETNPIIYTLAGSDIWVFREDLDRDGTLLSQRNLQLGENHLIIFRKSLVNPVMNCLEKVCEREVEKPMPIRVNNKGEDWLYLWVEPVKLCVFDQKLWRLSVAAGKRLSFRGGLSVTNQSKRKAYLDICLPNVFVPDLGHSDQEPLRIDDQELPLDKNRLVTLCNVRGPGVYQLTYGRQTKELRVISAECSLEHHNKTLIASISQDQSAMPAYSIKEIAEVSEKFGLWLTGAKFFGTEIPEVSWKDMEEIPQEPPPSKPSFKVPANVVSSVVRVAIDFKQGKTSAPDWFEEAIEYLDQNVALRGLVQKKLNIYHEIAVSYVELREKVGK